MYVRIYIQGKGNTKQKKREVLKMKYLFSTSQADDINWFIDYVTEQVYRVYSELSEDEIMDKIKQTNYTTYSAALDTIGEMIRDRVNAAIEDAIAEEKANIKGVE